MCVIIIVLTRENIIIINVLKLEIPSSAEEVIHCITNTDRIIDFGSNYENF